MPTMKDIAKRAGVSYGTASNVLNRRGNVAADKIKAVEKAAEELGYYIHEKASDLRSNKVSDVALIVPTLDDLNLRGLYNLMRKKLKADGFKLNLYITDYNPVLEDEYSKIATRTNRFLIVSSCLSNPEDLYNRNIFSNTVLIFVNSQIKLDQVNVFRLNFDSNQLASDLSAYVENNDYQEVLCFADSSIVNDKLLTTDTIDYHECSQPFNLSTAIDILSQKTYDLIIVTSNEKYKSVLAAQNILQHGNGSDVIEVTNEFMTFGQYSIPYHMDMNLCVEQILHILDSTLNNRTINRTIIIPYSGLASVPTAEPTDKRLKLLMIESPATTALLKITKYIEKLLGFNIDIDVIKYNDYDTVMDEDTIKAYDLIRIDMAYLPEVAERTFKPLDMDFSKLTARLIDNIREYTHHNDRMYTLPFDIGCQILMYRSDVLNNQRIKREYFEETKRTAIVPRNYSDYNNLESFINQNYGNIFQGSTVCTGSKITCGNEFIIRSETNNVLDKNQKLDTSRAEVMNALKSYLKSVSYSKSSNRFWDDVIKEYSKGNTVMSIVYSNYIHLLKDFNKDILYKTDFTHPPNMKSLIGGGVIGLSKHTKNDSLCHAFLKVLYSDKISKLLTHLGGTMPIHSIYNDIDLISMYPWLKLIPKILENNTRRHYKPNGQVHKTIPYEKAIGREVKNYIAYNLHTQS